MNRQEDSVPPAKPGNGRILTWLTGDDVHRKTVIINVTEATLHHRGTRMDEPLSIFGSILWRRYMQVTSI